MCFVRVIHPVVDGVRMAQLLIDDFYGHVSIELFVTSSRAGLNTRANKQRGQQQRIEESIDIKL